jgi:hypothetical protein
MTIISGTSAANPSYPIISGEHTGIGFGNFTTRFAKKSECGSVSGKWLKW